MYVSIYLISDLISHSYIYLIIYVIPNLLLIHLFHLFIFLLFILDSLKHLFTYLQTNLFLHYTFSICYLIYRHDIKNSQNSFN